jgi:O-antigen ligase
LSDWLGQGIGNDAYTIDRPTARFFDFFAIDAAIMMPVATAALLNLAMRTSVRLVLGLVLLIAYVLVVISGIRAALLAVTLVTFIQLLPLIWKYKRQALLLVTVLVIAGSIFFAPRIDKLTERYSTIFSASTYQSQEQGYSSFYERRSIWKGALDMIKERPLLGYGLGWQKFYDVAHNEGFFERWQQSDKLIDRTVANYFKPLEKGQANPHNVWVQILFETGILGLLAYISMLTILLYRAFKSLKRASQSAVTRCFGSGALAYMLSYLMINMMNGLWLGAGATLALLIVSEILRNKDEARLPAR